MAKKKSVPKPNELSLAQLQQLIENKASELSELKAKRAELQKELNELDRLIQQTEGASAMKTVAKKKVARSTTAGASTKKKKVAKKKRTRVKNQQSAKAYAMEILGKEAKGLPLNQLADRILASGYQTESEDFKITLYQSLYKDRKAGKTFNYSDKTGHWTLK